VPDFLQLFVLQTQISGEWWLLLVIGYQCLI
jgi:hypothetical protein